MATSQVLNTYELRELILLQLPFFDLLKARAVAKQWRAHVDSAVQLRRALFLELPASGPLRLDPEECTLKRAGYDDGGERWDDYQPAAYINVPMRVSPLFKPQDVESRREAWSYTTWPQTQRRNSKGERATRQTRIQLFTLPLNLHVKLASGNIFDAMFISQPPVIGLDLEVFFGVASWGSMNVRVAEETIDVTAWDAKGVTMGLVAETVERVVRDARELGHAAEAGGVYYAIFRTVASDGLVKA